MTEIYLDNHTVTKPDEEAVKRMIPFLEHKWGNHTQPHDRGQRLCPEAAKECEQIYRLLQADEEDTILFTSSGEEAIHHVFDFVHRTKVREEGRNHFITLACDEAPVRIHMQESEAAGCFVTYVPTPFGRRNIDDIIHAITPRTALISIPCADGLTGLIHSPEELIEVCRTRNIYLHTDISYSFGKIPFRRKKESFDFITLGGDRIHSVKSSGLLYARKEIPLPVGGRTLDEGSLAAFSQALQKMYDHTTYLSTEILRLRNLFENKLREKLPDIQILFRDHKRLPNVSVISFPKMTADSLLFSLNRRGLHACFGGSRMQKLSLLLEGIGFPPQTADSALSFAFSRDTSKKDMEKAVDIISEEAEKLRKLSNRLEEDLWD